MGSTVVLLLVGIGIDLLGGGTASPLLIPCAAGPLWALHDATRDSEGKQQ